MNLKTLMSSLMVASALSWTANAEHINRIIVDGNKRVETSTIESYLTIKPGDNLTNDKQDASIKSLFNTALFDNVKITHNAGTMYVHVEETPLVIKVLIKGNSKVSSKKINNEVMTKAGSSLRLSDIEYDKNKIIEMYKKSGRFAVRVTPDIKKLENNRVKVTFNVIEGPKTAVKTIRFVGNNNYRSNELKSLILTKESAWYRFLESNDTYDPDRMEVDKQFLTDFYNSVGFADFKILSSSAELSPTKDHFVVTYALEEGPKYKFGDVEVQNNLKEVKTDYLRRKIKIRKGKVFNGGSIDRAEDAIGEWLGDHGYPLVNVDHEVIKDPVTRTAHIKFIVDKADKAFVRKINISGNLKTHEKVIRREFKIAEGDVLNRSQITKAWRNLRRLDYFEKVAIDPKPTNVPGRYDINVDVQEKSTASIGLDVGYNTASGPFSRISYDDKNVLGTGKDFNAAVQIAKRSSSYSVGLTEPYFMDKNLSLGTSLFYSTVGSDGLHTHGFWGENSSYKLETKGAKVSAGYDLIDDLSHNVFYTIKHDNLSVSKNQNSIFIMEQVGKYTTSAIGHSITLDKTDNIYMPKSGFSIIGTQEFAGVGGENKYLKHDLTANLYSSYSENKYTLKLSGSVGDIRAPGGHTVRINDRFNLGDASMRGFAPQGIGPRDKRSGEGLGGKKYYSATAELQFPIGMPQEFNLTGALFTDVGGVYDFDIKKAGTYSRNDINDSKDARISYGVGLIWNTRIAPIRIDYALRLRKKSYDEVQPWHLRFSTHF